MLDPTTVTDWGSQTTIGDLAFIAMTALFPVVGILIIHRQPRNTVGWLLHATGVAWGLWAWTDAYIRLSLHLVDWVPGGIAVEVVGAALWWPPIVVMGVFTILFFPDGKLPSRRWLFLPWLAGIDCLVGMVLIAVAPGDVTEVLEPLPSNPLALPLSHGLVVALMFVVFPPPPFSLLAAAGPLLSGSSGRAVFSGCS